MAEPYRNPPTGPDADRAKMRRVLFTAGGIALVIILVAVIASVSGGGGRSMSDGSDGTADDPGLKEIVNGVKFRDLKEGSGEPCPPGAKVKINYTGWLTDGTVFDSTKDRGPAEFELKGLIQGWQIGIPGMKPGGVRKLVIPPDMGYANRARDKIPPGSTLIFEVELLSATPKPAAKLSDGTSPAADDHGLKDIGDGLKIRDLKEGSGEPVKPGATVTVHYTGWTLDGNVFDSSKKTGVPFPANLDPNAPRGVIAGWQKGIPGMKPGGVRKLVIPAPLAYGVTGSPPDIPPNATLIFEVELIR